MAITHCSTFASPLKSPPHDQRLAKELQSPTHSPNDNTFQHIAFWFKEVSYFEFLNSILAKKTKITMYGIDDKPYSEAIDELIGNQEEIKTINFINWWIIKHEDLFNQAIVVLTDSCCRNKYCIGMVENCEFTTIQLFKKYYGFVDKMTQDHKYEDYFEKELQYFNANITYKTKLNELLEKNKQIVEENFVLFVIDYLEYSEKPFHLKNSKIEKDGIDFYVNRNDFIHTINFLELFHKSYYV